MINKKKKKGFTLIELIAVIAILAILGAILIPRVSGYTASARKSKDLTDAKQIVQAIEAYNAANDTILDESVSFSATTLVTYLPTVPPTPKTIVAPLTTGKTWTDLTYAQIRSYATALETP